MSPPVRHGIPFFMAKLHKIDIDDLLLDEHNANAGTPDGNELIGESINTLGMGRSVLVDSDNRLIAGNKTTEQARANGIKKVVVVDTDGTELIVVRRNDLILDDPDDQRGRALALADNETARRNLLWNPDNLKLHFDAVSTMGLMKMVFDVKHGDAGGGSSSDQTDQSDAIGSMFKIEISFADETEQEAAFETLTKMGYECKILTL